jgi:NDP-sugar pyrophosphorylase family protein
LIQYKKEVKAMKTLHVSAGGRGERIAAYISSIRPFFPKHLLPIPTEGRTILGEIIFRAYTHFEDITVWSSKETYPRIALALEDLMPVRVRVDAEMTGPLGPMVRALLTNKQRTFGCAGDFYCNFSWKEFEKFHDSHGLPISILVAKSVPAPGGARFHLNDGNITGWERVEKTAKDDRINIGCYIVDPVSEVVSGLKALKRHKEDPFFDVFVPKKLVAGYDPDALGFNVNVAEVYERLLHFLT